jgi:hypothetical protein
MACHPGCGAANSEFVSVMLALTFFFQPLFFKTSHLFLQLLAMDVSAQATMKDAAKCDKRCEWQNSANQ